MSINWNEAPEGAQRCSDDTCIAYKWLKRDADGVQYYNSYVERWETYNPDNFGLADKRWNEATPRPAPKHPDLDWKDAPDWATEIREISDGSKQYWANDYYYSYDCVSTYLRGRMDDEINSTLVSLRPKSADEPKSALDTQRGGDHYKKLGTYQPWEVLQKWMTPDELRGHMKGTVIGYLSRERDKGGDLDIEKAFHTMEIYLEVAKRYETN